MADFIKLGVKLDVGNAEKQLKSEIEKLSKSNLKLNIDFNSKNLNFNNITKEVNNLNNKLKNGLNLDGITKSAYSSAKEIENQYKSLGETIGKLHEKSDFKINTKNGLQEAKEVNRALEERYKSLQKINSFKETGTNSLNKLKLNGLVDISTINSLQSKLNSINTDTPEKEIKELQNAIKNLGSSESGIVRLQNQITKMETNLGNLKSKFGEGFINSKASDEIKQYESEISKLKSTMSNMKTGTSFSSSKITSDLNSASNASRNLNNALKESGTHAETFGSKMKSALGNMGLWMSTYQGIQLAVNTMKDGVKTITDIDTKIRDLRRVSDGISEDVIKNYPLQANKLGIDLGKSTEDIISMTTMWKQLGYTFEESSGDLVKWSTILSNVGDLSAEDSANDLVSTLKAFKLEAKDVSMVVDTLNESGNKFALTTGDMAEGLRVGGASLSVANNDLYESEALIITGTEVLRSSDEVATGLKTIAMRLDQVKTSKGDTFYKLQSDLKNIADVDLTDTEGNLRSTYDIILDLSKNWDKLTDMQQAQLLDEVAGKNQAKVLSAIIQNADQLPKAYEAMKNASGSAMREQESYMDSIEGKANALKESVKKLWLQVLSSDTIKSVVDFLTQCVQGLSNIDGSTVKLIASLTGLGLAFKSILTFTNALKGVTFLSELGKGSGAIGNLVGGFASLGNVLKSIVGLINPITAGIGILGVVTVAGINGWNEYKNAMEDTKGTKTADDLGIVASAINELNGHVIRSKKELQDAGLVYEDFGEGVSDSFKNGVESARKTFQEFNMELSSLGQDGSKIELQGVESGKIKGMVDKIADEARTAVNSKKGEIQQSFTELFSDDGTIDESEAELLNSLGQGFDAKLGKIDELHQQIYDIWNKAIEEHGQLSEEDIQQIRNYVAQIQQIQMETKAENNSDWFDLRNKFTSRVKEMSVDDAVAEYKKSNDELKDMFAEKKTVYDNGVEMLKNQRKAQEQIYNDDSVTEAQRESAKKSIDLLDEQIKNYDEKYQALVDEENEKRRELVNTMLKMNPNLRSEFNEITGEKFAPEDKKANAELRELEETYQAIDDVNKSGLTEIKNTDTDMWNQIYVEVDKATGKIVGTYNRTTGDVTGYTQEYKEKMEKLRDEYQSFQEIFRDQSKFNSGILGGQKLSIDGDGNFKINDDVITQLQVIKEEADGTKTALASINDQKVEFNIDKNGAITNLDEIAKKLGYEIPDTKTIMINAEGNTQVVDKIQGEITNLPDKKECKVEIGSTGVNNVDELSNKIENLPNDYPIDITINGENVNTVEELKEKLNEVPKDTEINVEANTEDANEKLEESSEKADELDDKNPVVETDADTNNTNSKLNETGEKVDELDEKVAEPEVRVNTNGAEGILSNILGSLGAIGGKVVTASVNVVKRVSETVGNGANQVLDRLGIPHHAKGTNYFKGNKKTKQWTWINEGNKGELVELPDGTKIIPNDLSEKMIKENADNSGNTVNNVTIQPQLTDADILRKSREKIYQDNVGYKAHVLSINTANTLDKPYEDTDFQEEFEEKDTTYMSSDEKKAYQSEKKQYELRKKEWEKQKKEKEKQEKIEKDRAEKEKQYLKDISSEWEINTKVIENNLNDLELKETEYGENITISQKVDLLNQKYLEQSKLIPEAENRIMTYKHAVVSTAEGQEELNKMLEEATDDWVKQKKAVAEAYNELKKYERDALGSLRDTLAQNILKEKEDKTKKIEEAEDNNIEKLENEKQAMIDSYEAQIEALRKELDALNDNSEDEEEKLRRLKKELALWEKDDSSFADLQKRNLEKQIKDQEKVVKRNELQQKIDDLNEQKNAESDSYDERIKALQDAQKERKKIEEKANEDSLKEKKAYAEADRLITQNNQEEMLRLLSKYAENYKDVGSLLGENFVAGFQEQISANMSNYLDLTGQNGKWTADVGDIVTIKDVNNERVFGNPTGGDVKGTASQFGLDASSKLTATQYGNGFLYLVDSNGNGIGWFDRYQLNKVKASYDNSNTEDEEDIFKKKKKISQFANGGRTPSNIDEGALAILHSNEAILNANDTETLDDIKQLMSDIKSLYKSNNIIASNYNNLYSNGLVNSYDLNRIQNMGNNYNNNDSHNQTIVNMTNNITNNNLREVGMNEKSFERMANKWIKNSGNKFK